MTKEKRKDIAIIGSGISGLGAAYLLAPHHNITVYEKNNYIGGHSRTIEVPTKDGNVPVDTGFIVFNYKNYPLLTSLFSHLNVPVEKSNMSFGVSIDNGWLEYGTQHLYNFFAQKSNLLRPNFWRLIADIWRFNRKAHIYLKSYPYVTMEQCLDELKMGKWFRDHFLLAMGAAIWSTPLTQMLKFPASTFIRFFDNHGLLTVNDQPQWYTVKGGSKEYVKRLTAGFKDRILLNCGVEKVIRNHEQETVIIQDNKGNSKTYDEVILACHADQALAIIDNPTEEERAVLKNLRYQPNRIVLHSDTSFMPKRRSAWSSWIYLSESANNNTKDSKQYISLSYWMNNLQPINSDTPIIITMNPEREPKKDLIYDEYWFDHPIFDEAAIRSQPKIGQIQGKDRLWFCGAYQRYGFHEDGLLSAVSMARKMGIDLSWK